MSIADEASEVKIIEIRQKNEMEYEVRMVSQQAQARSIPLATADTVALQTR